VSAVAYVRDMSMIREGHDTRCTITIEVYGWEGPPPAVNLMVSESVVGVELSSRPRNISFSSTPQPARKKKAAEEEAPSSPCLPLRDPKEPTRWNLLEIDK
jgi:hypothetical protein